MSYIKYFVSVIGGGFIYWLGGVDNLLTCLTVLIVIDYLTGVIGAIINNTLSSAVGFVGIAKKFLIYLIIIVAYTIEKVTNGAFAVREIVIMFFIVNEAISLLENAGKMGVKYPDKLKDILAQLKEN